MRRKRHRKVILQAIVAASLFGLGAVAGQAQEARRSAGSSPAGSETASEVRVLTELIRDLQVQVQTLNSQVGDLRTEQQRSSDEARSLRQELEATKAQLAPVKGDSENSYLSAIAKPMGMQPSAESGTSTPQEQASVTDRIAKLEENQEITDTRLNEQNQTKIESGSKYRMRLSGIVLLNLYDNSGAVDNQDFPQFSQSPLTDPIFASSSSFGGTIRQSQIKLQVFGPDIMGARTSADVEFDFAGGFPNAWNGVATGLVRLRTGTVRLDWQSTSVVAGQDRLFFAPLSPTSLATLANPPLSYSGNLWSWTPQVRIEHRIQLSDTSNVMVQAGILDSLTGDYPVAQSYRYPAWGEESGQPAYATRIAWSQRVLGQNLTVGAAGYYGRQNWGFSRSFNGWAGMMDVTLPLGKLFEFTGAFYRGSAVAGLGGGIGQTVVVNGNFFDPATTFRGLDSVGGWAQLKYKPRTKLEFNAALGIDNPFTHELRAYKAFSIYPGIFVRNLTPIVNFIYQLRSDVLFSVEYRHMQTSILDGGAANANHVNLSLGYIF